jgi:hypothetical protein
MEKVIQQTPPAIIIRKSFLSYPLRWQLSIGVVLGKVVIKEDPGFESQFAYIMAVPYVLA